VSAVQMLPNEHYKLKEVTFRKMVDLLSQRVTDLDLPPLFLPVLLVFEKLLLQHPRKE
jgi:hypothetical protein